MPGNFFDSNVLLYLASDDAKASRAEKAIAEGGTTSVQVLNEIAHVAHRKTRMSWRDINDFLALLKGLLEIRPLTLEIHEIGLQLAERYKFQLFDGMIAASALEAGCDTLLTENMQHGMILREGLRITNPFRTG